MSRARSRPGRAGPHAAGRSRGSTRSRRSPRALRVARGLVADIGRWTQDSAARTPGGEAVSATSPDAARWCAQGAVVRAVHDLRSEFGIIEARIHSIRRRAVARLDAAAVSVGSGGPHALDLNDSRGVPAVDVHAEVLAIFDLAVRRTAAETA